jgi:hypothetical protein
MANESLAAPMIASYRTRTYNPLIKSQLGAHLRSFYENEECVTSCDFIPDFDATYGETDPSSKVE